MTRDFWEWALKAYARPGVAEASLKLQDEYGQSIPLLLWAAWVGKVDADTAQIAAALTRAWSPVIEPLRDVRRRLKAEISPGDEVDRLALRVKVKAIELEAEKALMARLEALMPHGPAPSSGDAAIDAAIRLDTLWKVADAWRADYPAEALAAWLALL